MNYKILYLLGAAPLIPPILARSNVCHIQHGCIIICFPIRQRIDVHKNMIIFRAEEDDFDGPHMFIPH